MSIIPYYVRADIWTIGAICADRERLFGAAARPPGIEMIDIGLAYEGLSWLVSPLKRAEVAFQMQLIIDRDWPKAALQARRAELDLLPVEDSLAALLGWSGEVVEPLAGALGGAVFAPPRVKALSTALAAVSEETLRPQLDPTILHAHLVAPEGWLEESEDIFDSYLMPALAKLQRFYRAAADAEQSVLIVMT